MHQNRSFADLLDSLGLAGAEEQHTRTICGFCGEVIAEGPMREGRNLHVKHLEQFHPEKLDAVATQARVRRMLRKGSTPSLITPERYSALSRRLAEKKAEGVAA